MILKKSNFMLSILAVLIGLILLIVVLANSAFAEGAASAGQADVLCHMPGLTLKHTDAQWRKIMAQSEQGDANAQFVRAMAYDCGVMVPKNAAMANQWLAKAAVQGLAKAEFALGFHYLMGVGVEQNQHKALAWLEKATAHGYASAQYIMARVYANGRGSIEKNPQRALLLMHKAAEQNYRPAQMRLGMYYSKGIGTKPDEAKAFKWFLRAANAGFAKSQALAGIYYAKGIGVKPDKVEAAKWLALSMQSLDPGSPLRGMAVKLLKTVVEAMSAEESKRAEAEVMLWMKAHRGGSLISYNASTQGKDALSLVNGFKFSFMEYFNSHGNFSGITNNSDIGMSAPQSYADKYVSSVAVHDANANSAQVTATFCSAKSGCEADAALQGKHLTLAAHAGPQAGRIKWVCFTDADFKFMPKKCHHKTLREALSQ